MNILNLNNARLNVIKHLKHIHFFYFFFKIFVNAFRRFFAKFIVINNLNRMRNQRLFTFIYKRVKKFIKRIKINFFFL